MRHHWWIGVAVVSVVLLGHAAPVPVVNATALAHASSTRAESVFNRMCTTCHDVSRIAETRRTRDQWETVLYEMAAKGAKGTDEDWDAVETYLLGHYGRAEVNRAPADDLAVILALSDEAAKAIVEYRGDHGPITDFDTLAGVPGVDAKALAAERDALDFDPN
jgi:hypothetical protein